jgi:GSH-dependent disulfide-bond oxidoreductase
VVEKSDGPSGPSHGGSPADVSFTNLADALGVSEYPPKDLIGVAASLAAPLFCAGHERRAWVATADRPRGKARQRAARRPDGALLLADAERLEDFDHARGMRLALCNPRGRHFQRRTVRGGLSGVSPNNRIPALVDPAGPGRRPISVFESGAILQYLGRKTGKFYPRTERARVAVDEWLFWQVGGLGPMAGQANHFRRYAPEPVAYAIARYTDEVNRLFGVMERRLAHREFLAGRYSIADMACVGWVRLAERMGQDLTHFPRLKRWLETIRARPAVKRAFAIRVEAASAVDINDPQVRAVLFGQRAR